MLIKMVSDGDHITGIEIDGVSIGRNVVKIEYSHQSMSPLRWRPKRWPIGAKPPRLRLWNVEGEVWDSRKDSFTKLERMGSTGGTAFGVVCDRCEAGNE